MKIRHICMMLMVLSSTTMLKLEQPVPARSSLQERTFELRYSAEVQDIPRGAKPGEYLASIPAE